jgi:hypothetical protein
MRSWLLPELSWIDHYSFANLNSSTGIMFAAGGANLVFAHLSLRKQGEHKVRPYRRAGF